ncbi:MAG TPA: TonB-dependent receptor [Steroidobacteraceae bacterium]|jgi:vitamin B12 transporter|nr:TonB-dependent receptor [Steroidobacteraceae bacterium]
MKLSVSIACAWAACWAQPAHAQIADSLDYVVVTARSLEDELPQQLAAYGTRVDTISAAKIRNGGYLDVAGALQALAPGLYISPKNGPFDYVQISLQGSRTTDVLWLVDGIRINNRLYAGTTPLDTLPAGMIDRIEVLNGGQALFYGTQAVAGAINIVTKGFSDHPDGAVSAGYDSNQAQQYNGFYRDSAGSNHFVVYATHDQAPGIEPFPDSEFQPSGTDRRRFYKVTSLGGKYAYDFSGALTVTAAYDHTNANLDFAQPQLTAIAYNQRNDDLVSAKLDYAPNDEFKLYIKDYYHWWYSHYTEFDNVIGSPGALTTIDDHDFWGFKDYGVNLLTQIAVNRGFEYLAGYDFQNYTGRDVVLAIAQQTEHVNAFFGQVRSTPDLIPNAHFAAGLRYNIPSVGESAVVWNGGGQYDFSKSLFVRANFGTAFRLPTAEELFADDPQDERGDPNLKPETSTNANVSIGGAAAMGAASIRWELIGFYRDIRNLIDFESFDSNANQDVFGNVPGTVTTRGVELTFDGPINASLSGSFSATYNRTRASGSDLQLNQIPAAQMKLGFDYHPGGAPYGASVNIVHLGDVDDEPLGSGDGRFGYGNYTVVDIGVRLFLDAARRQRADLHVNNAFNKGYSSGLGHGVDDMSGDAYVVHDLALPRTIGFSYSYSF